MKKFFAFLCTLLLLGTAFTVYAASGRESTMLPPQEVEIMYPSEGYAYQVKDLSDVVRWRVMPDGTQVTYNSSGNTVFVIGSGGVATLASSGTVAATSAGWTLTTPILTSYDTFLIDPGDPKAYTDKCPIGIGSSGATVVLTGLLTSAIHGKSFKFINSMGTTAFVLYDANGRFNGGSGTTENPTPSAARGPEDQGDTVEVTAIFTPTAVSGWYVTNIKNFD